MASQLFVSAALRPREERRLAAALPGWRCLPDAVIRAAGEAGPVDLVVLGPSAGVALIAFIAEDEETSPEEAVAAFRLMLEELGFAAQFPGELPVVALPVAASRRHFLAEAIRETLGAAGSCSVAVGWCDWLAERLTEVSRDSGPRLTALKPGEEAFPSFLTEGRLDRAAAPVPRKPGATWVQVLLGSLAFVLLVALLDLVLRLGAPL